MDWRRSKWVLPMLYGEVHGMAIARDVVVAGDLVVAEDVEILDSA